MEGSLQNTHCLKPAVYPTEVQVSVWGSTHPCMANRAYGWLFIQLDGEAIGEFVGLHNSGN